MNKQKIIETLDKLEQTQHKLYGYNAKEILVVLGTNINRENEKKVRKQLRLLISKQLYPEFATAGNEDIVYCPNGKGSGTYRLSKYRG